jgi:ectoine hydroxylase-related dioxygenase (phytanoyl-CoA dioxygenase family)
MATSDASGTRATESMPRLDDPYRLDPACLAEFRDKGHTVVRRLCTPNEVAAFRPAIEDAALAHSRETRPLEERDTYGKAFLQVQNLWRRDERVRSFVFAPRFAQVAAALLEVDGVRLYHDQALFKEPHGGYTPWHQDQTFWPFDTDRTITMWMPLVDVPAVPGSMTFASGTHRMGLLGEIGISDKTHQNFDDLVAERGLTLETHGALRAGDATFHAGWTLHNAGANPTAQMRAVMTVIYFADGARVGTIDHPYQQYDLDKWLRPCQPGDLAAGELNPVLYPPSSPPSSIPEPG